jgi:UDP-N-acetylmuramoyl-L-alanine---L-glutamate ligase
VAKTWADLAGLRVGILGAGIEGRHAFARLKDSASALVVVDDNPEATIDGKPVLSGPQGFEALSACDVIVKSPGFSRYRPDVVTLAERGIPVVGSLGLSLNEIDPQRVIAVTGTKGKSTTSSIIFHLAQGLGLRSLLIGNIGTTPPSRDELTSYDLIVAEVSSFQVLDLEQSPGVVVVTSLGTDHVDWHGSPEQYRHDKLRLTRLEGPHRSVLQGNDELLRNNTHDIGGELVWSTGRAGAWAGALGLVGTHNQANAELARIALIEAGVPGADNDEKLAVAASGFTPLRGRLTLIAQHDDVSFIDDSLATNVTPTMAALDAVEGQRLALLIGGFDRGIDYQPLIERLAQREAATLVIGLPDSGPQLVNQILALSATTQGASAASIDEAVRHAWDFVAGGGVVLMSPAAPSFSQFKSWKERSDAFALAVTAITGVKPLTFG